VRTTEVGATLMLLDRSWKSVVKIFQEYANYVKVFYVRKLRKVTITFVMRVCMFVRPPARKELLHSCYQGYGVGTQKLRFRPLHKKLNMY
jgi:hypothetical protein